jgi:peptide/nickel transport system substrate-binding protein
MSGVAMNTETNYWTQAAVRRIGRRRVLIGVSGIALGAWALTGCGGSKGGPVQSTGTTSGSPATGTPVPGGALNVPQASNAPTLDPLRTTSFYTLLPASAVYSRPLRFTTGPDSKVIENHDVEADLATSAESPDAITWTLKLRPDVKFHNLPPVSGRALDADDMRLSFQRALSADNPARSGLDMIDPAQITTPDAQTVVFKLKFPYAPFKATLASPNYSWMMPKEAGSGFDPAKTMIGSGPFVFESYTPDVAFAFKKNAAWFGTPQPYVDSLKWAIIPDASTQRAQFISGNLDLLGTSGTPNLAPGDIPSLRQSAPKAEFSKGNPNAGQVMFMRLDDPSSPFQDIRLRQAFSVGIDRDAIAKALYSDDAVEQFVVPLSMGKWALTVSDLPADTAQYYKYDIGKAKQLLQAAGTGNQAFKLIYITGFLGPQYEQAAQTAANMLQGAGINITPVSIDYVKDYIGGGKGVRYGNFDTHSVVFTGLSNYMEVDEYLSNYWHSGGSSSLSKLSDRDLDNQIAKARTLVNDDDRVSAYQDIQRYIVSKVYAISGLHLPYLYTVAGGRTANYCPDLSYGFGVETLAKMWIKA